MIEVSHVSHKFGNFQAVNDISFSIPTGQVVGLLGPNGAGKTTTMRMITGFLKPTSGTIFIDGKSVTEPKSDFKKKIGYMPESAPLYSEMIVEDYLRYVAEMYGQNAEEKIPVLCQTCGLAQVMSKNIGELSRGYRQRVGLAHALMNDPEILILDEPTSGLDPNQISDVRALIKEIGKTRTVIVSTHILGEVEMISDRVIIISGGKIVADSPTAELREKYGHAERIKISAGECNASELISALENIDGVEKISSTENEETNTIAVSVSVSIGENQNAKKICSLIAKKIVERNWDLYEIVIEKNSLEDVFHELTQESDTQQAQTTQQADATEKEEAAE